MLKKIMYVVLLLVFVYFILCIAGPKKMEVTTTKTIKASPTAVFTQIADLRNMQNWSKWMLEDTAMNLTWGKKTSGVGGTYSWKSEKSGAGSMTITRSDLNSLLAYDLTFVDFDAVSDVKMELKPNGANTDITWSLMARKENPFLKRGMMLIMNMNGSLKKDFDKGLENLDKYLQGNPDMVLMNGYLIDEGSFKSTDYLQKRAIVKMDSIDTFFGNHFPAIAKLAGAAITGAPSGIYWNWDEVKMQADMAAAMPVNDKNLKSDQYSVINLADSKEFVLHYYGAYDHMKTAHQTLDSMIKMHGFTFPDIVVEEYISDPMSQKDTAQWYTKIHYLVSFKE